MAVQPLSEIYFVLLILEVRIGTRVDKSVKAECSRLTALCNQSGFVSSAGLLVEVTITVVYNWPIRVDFAERSGFISTII